MADSSYQPKVYRKQGGDELVVASGGEINIEAGGIISAAGTQAAAMTAALTTITLADSNASADYALQALTTTTPYGFATQAEAISFTFVVQNLQVQVAEMRAALVALGVVPS